MAPSYGRILPNTYVFLRLPSDIVKLIELKPNTIIEVGKYGTFPSNLLIGKPYYTTFEILDKREGEAHVRLRYVPAKELNAEVVAEYDAEVKDGDEVSEAAEVDEEKVMASKKDNRLTVDNAARQNLSHLEIEALKQTVSGREIIDTIMANHNALDEKTSYSKAKYSLRKAKKYLKRFTVLPMEIGTLQDYVREKEPGRILEMREESLALITAWSNAHFSEALTDTSMDAQSGRWLAVDDSGGLIVAALAERMGILRKVEKMPTVAKEVQNGDHSMPDAPLATEDGSNHRDFPLPATSNTITNLHSMVQQNVSLLKFFGYDSNTPDTDHPLHDRLLPISWLQLLHADQDPTYREPDL
ncbi:tRNA (adenine(58)-N(1))-methyltransferase non-catalytic subunit trm6, partial [Oleoguttula sp. CCFEE 5521]